MKGPDGSGKKPAAEASKKKGNLLYQFFSNPGPGLTTGAADDDGILLI